MACPWVRLTRFLSCACAMVLLLACASCTGSSQSKVSTKRPSLVSLAKTVTSMRLRIATPRIVSRACRKAQQKAHLRVWCPHLVPSGAISTISGLSGVLQSEPGFYALSFNNGNETPSRLSIHWIVGRGSLSEIDRNVLSDRRNEVKGLPHHLDESVNGGVIVQTYRFPSFPAGGPYGDHTLAVVRSGDDAVFASVHGYTHLDASIAMAVALALYR
jgi:hypothetical protein